MRAELMAAVNTAMKSGDRLKVDTLRMVLSALKNREIEARGSGETLSRNDESAVLRKLAKSRRDAAELYDKAGRPDLAAKERAEIAIIAAFLPEQMSEDEVAAAIAAAISASGATGVKDTGKVIGLLKTKYADRIDFAQAGLLVKTALAR